MTTIECMNFKLGMRDRELTVIALML
jgi:hypothetical protein